MSDDAANPRPYRLWNAKEKEFLRWRCYLYLKNAHLAALIELRWSPVNTTLEVLDVHHANKLHGQYTRTVDSVRFRGGDNVIEKAPRKKKAGKRKAAKARGEVDRETGEIRSQTRH